MNGSLAIHWNEFKIEFYLWFLTEFMLWFTNNVLNIMIDWLECYKRNIVYNKKPTCTHIFFLKNVFHLFSSITVKYRDSTLLIPFSLSVCVLYVPKGRECVKMLHLFMRLYEWLVIWKFPSKPLEQSLLKNDQKKWIRQQWRCLLKI